MNSIFHRISVRKYEDRPVEKEKIMEILKAGMQAPSACNQQPWEFFVVTDKEKIQKLSKVTPYTGCAAGAPVVIVPVYYTEGLVAPSFAQIDMAIAQQKISGWKQMRWASEEYGLVSHRWRIGWKKSTDFWSFRKM